ncbi:MAG: glycosyltransferase [Methylotetracoccus sp.]
MKTEILYISPFLPYDKVAYAGGKSHNFYLKSFSGEEKFHVTLISYGSEGDKDRHDLCDFNIRLFIDFERKTIANKARRIFTKLNPFSQFGFFYNFPSFKFNLLRSLESLRSEHYAPDVVIIEWTMAAFFIKEIKKYFPLSFYYCFEHDVSFQSIQRLAASVSMFVKPIINCQHHFSKKAELEAMQEADRVVVHNEKDRQLLVNEGISSEKILHAALFYDDYRSVAPDYRSNNIVFYGAMDRRENYLSVAWFIEHVFERLMKSGFAGVLYVMGRGAPQRLLKHASDRIIFTGFVESPGSVFERASYMVAPLVGGGGLKVKVLEGMSAGLVLVGNHIAFEGIPVTHGVDCFRAETPDDYIRSIMMTASYQGKKQEIGRKGRELIHHEFDFKSGYERWKRDVLKNQDKRIGGQ